MWEDCTRWKKKHSYLFILSAWLFHHLNKVTIEIIQLVIGFVRPIEIWNDCIEFKLGLIDWNQSIIINRELIINSSESWSCKWPTICKVRCIFRAQGVNLRGKKRVVIKIEYAHCNGSLSAHNSHDMNEKWKFLQKMMRTILKC